MILKEKVVINQYDEPIKVVLRKEKYGYSVIVGTIVYVKEYNELFAVQRFNEI